MNIHLSSPQKRIFDWILTSQPQNGKFDQFRKSVNSVKTLYISMTKNFLYFLYIYIERNTDYIIDKSHNIRNPHEILTIILILNIFFFNLIKLIKIQIIAFKKNQC